MCTRHLQRAPLGTGPSCGMWTVPCKWASRLVFSPALENHSGQHHLKQGPLQEVACSVVTSGDNCWARLTDNKSGVAAPLSILVRQALL